MSFGLQHSRYCQWVISVAVLAMFAAGCGREPQPAPPAADGDPAKPVDVQGSATLVPAPERDKIQTLEQVAVEYEGLQAEAEQTNRRMVEALSKYQRRGGKLPPNFGPDLSEQQRDLLAFLILNERAGTRDLLQEILDKDAQVGQLRGQMQAMQTRLPDHTVAREGDRHDRLALKYLADKGVPANQAAALIAQVSLQRTLLPGFNVWTYYADGQFGTWVTKGSAAISPQQQQERVLTDLASARDAAIKAKAEMETQLTTTQLEVKAKIDHAEQQAKDASLETGAALEMLAKAVDGQKQVESTVLFIAGSKRQLEKQGIIKGNRVLDITRAQFTSLDITSQREILLDPAPFELGSIKKVTVLPEIFAEGRDYQLQKEGAMRRFLLVNVDFFRRNQFIIVIE